MWILNFLFDLSHYCQRDEVRREEQYHCFPEKHKSRVNSLVVDQQNVRPNCEQDNKHHQRKTPMEIIEPIPLFPVFSNNNLDALMVEGLLV